MEIYDYYGELLKQIKVAKDRIRGVVHGESNGMYLHGRPGTAKTYMVRTTLETLAVNYAYSNGHLTPIGLFDLIAENRERIIVLDDVSAIFNQPIALQILLAALGSPHDGSRIRYVKYKTAKETRIVPFSGGIICISNLSLDGHHHEVLAALRDRIYVINYEPTDEQLIAQILHLADQELKEVPADKAKMVAVFTIDQCKLRGIRPSVRLFVDKALTDYRLWAGGKTETHWRDLIVSNLEQQLIDLQHPTNDLSRTEQIDAERRIALEIYLNYETRNERVEAWKKRTGKSQAAFYRRIKELQQAGLLPKNGDGNNKACDS